jgi:hypothetical protein
MAKVTVLHVSPISACDYHIKVEVDGEPDEFVARRVRYEDEMPIVGELEPMRVLRELPVDQFRELVRLVIAVHSGGLPAFPVLLGEDAGWSS